MNCIRSSASTRWRMFFLIKLTKDRTVSQRRTFTDRKHPLSLLRQCGLLHTAITRHGTPEIINSDQGALYTCAHWIDTLTDLGVAMSMDGKGRATDNNYIERWFRTLKQRYVYLNPASNGLEFRRGLERFVKR
jgi:transposase InsO family protein